MDQLIKYYYDMNPINIYNGDKYITFNHKGYSYILIPYEQSDANLNFVNRLSSELLKNDFKCHEIVLTRFNQIILKSNNKRYVLLKLNSNPHELVDMIDIIHYQNRFVVNQSHLDNRMKKWGELWKNKIDYYEIQLRSLGMDKKVIISCFSYYIGLAENAVIYYNNSLNDPRKLRYVLSHKRIFYPNYWINYGNPFSFIFDVPERDESEYIKYVFFYGEQKEAYDVFNLIISRKKMSSKSAHMLLSRLLFPTYFFDIYEQVIMDEESEEKVINILNKRKEYEKFLKYCFVKASDTIININSFPEWLL